MKTFVPFHAYSLSSTMIIALTAFVPALSSAETAPADDAVRGIISSMVQIPGKDYRIGSTEVTRAQWKAVMGKLSAHRGMQLVATTAQCPMVCVSWEDCQEFIAKLNAHPMVKQAGLTFRLPTADEWEHACRAGSAGKYSKMEGGREVKAENLGDVAWFVGNSWKMVVNEEGKEERVELTSQPVAKKKPNAFGLYDMHGNVWEWTSTVTEDGKDRVFCGGFWDSSAGQCESSVRYRNLPTYWEDFLGLRLCATGGTK